MVKRRLLNNNKAQYFWSLILLTAFIIFAPTHSAKAQVFNAETFTLDNGMQVVIVPNHRAPVVTHSLWYKVGAADEVSGSSGMAHYFEHLMFKGTKTIAPGDFARIIKKHGGNHNAFTNQDYTAYYQLITVQHLEKMMELEADRMANLSVPKEYFDSEKKVVLEERRQRSENDPSGLFTEQMRSALYVNHPYGTPIIGWMDEIKGYEWEDVKSFYDTWYAPNNAILVISGDVTAKTVRPIAERTYGMLKPKDIPERKRPKIPPAKGSTEMTLRHPTIHQPSFQQVFLAPTKSGNKKDALALQVLKEIMSGGATTRLYQKLVVEEKKAIAAGISYSGGARDYGSIWVTGRPVEGVGLRELKDLVHIEIKDVIDNGVTEVEVKEAIQRLQDSAIFARDSLKGPAMTFGYALTAGSTIDDIEYWPENIGKVTAADVQAVATKYLDQKNPWHRAPITGYLRPKKSKENKKETSQ